MELECYPTENRPPEIVPGRPQRAWMDHFADRHAYRCLPLTMANTTGWEILCPVGFTATWTAGPTRAPSPSVPTIRIRASPISSSRTSRAAS